MKKRKIALLAGVAAAAAIALASCGGSSTPKRSSKTRASSPSITKTTERLDVYYTYDGYAYVDSMDTFTNPVTQTNYVDKDRLPVWDLYSEKLTLDIKNACTHDGKRSASKYDQVVGNSFKSETDASQNIDLYGTTLANINKLGTTGNLLNYLDYMPNFKAFLDANPAIEDQLTVDGAIYCTPYFDGYNNIERMILMDTSLVEKLLDQTSTAQFDQTVFNTDAKFQPFINNDYNYDSNKTIKVSKDGVAKDITVKKTENIIKQQNAVLKTATGKQLADQFIAYLNAAYGDEVGANKTYSKLSEIFTSEAACYNTDDLIALMRVFKANPNYISNGETTDVVPLIHRQAANNRVEMLVSWMGEVFGVQGMSGETDRLYYAADGTLNDGATTLASYQALELMSQLYDEGLILQNFYLTKDSDGVTKYAEKYFAKNITNYGYALMEHDYSGTQSAHNALDENGIGTSDAKFKGTERSTLMPILSPVTYWATDSYSNSRELKDHSGKTLTRYYEENRALKTDSWCIPTTTDNLYGALQLMDYLLGEEGRFYNDFGPKAYWKGETQADYISYAGETTPQLSNTVKTWYASSGLDFWKFLRKYIGTTDAVGYVRTSTIDYQATNVVTRIGSANLSAAMLDGAQKVAKVQADAKFGSSVPSAGWPVIGTDNANAYGAITQFWAQDKCQDNATGWVKVVVDPAGTYSATNTTVIGTTATSANYSYKDVMDQFSVRNSNYLRTYAEFLYDLGAAAVPSYVKAAK